MAKLSQNISKLVFRRNIPFKMETYVLNCEMLQVLVEMDGIRTVAAIAAKLNRQVGDLVTTFATLYQQKLIFLVKPNPAIITQPAAKVTIIDNSKERTAGVFEKTDEAYKKEGPNERAVKCYENGLIFLKRRLYRKALHQFELALEFDPQNRLCHAYIQKILKLLKRDKNRHLRIT
jgi:tetratricopeptide (TPR) repeat protein